MKHSRIVYLRIMIANKFNDSTLIHILDHTELPTAEGIYMQCSRSEGIHLGLEIVEGQTRPHKPLNMLKCTDTLQMCIAAVWGDPEIARTWSCRKGPFHGVFPSLCILTFHVKCTDYVSPAQFKPLNCQFSGQEFRKASPKLQLFRLILLDCKIGAVKLRK